MGGAAGGALQTGQRIGASIGAAVLVTVYQLAGTAPPTPGCVRPCSPVPRWSPSRW